MVHNGDDGVDERDPRGKKREKQKREKNEKNTKPEKGNLRAQRDEGGQPKEPIKAKAPTKSTDETAPSDPLFFFREEREGKERCLCFPLQGPRGKHPWSRRMVENPARKRLLSAPPGCPGTQGPREGFFPSTTRTFPFSSSSASSLFLPSPPSVPVSSIGTNPSTSHQRPSSTKKAILRISHLHVITVG